MFDQITHCQMCSTLWIIIAIAAITAVASERYRKPALIILALAVATGAVIHYRSMMQ